MDCKKCGIELMILERGPLLFENDDRADVPTRAYYNFKFKCRNPACVNHDKVVCEEKVYIDD